MLDSNGIPYPPTAFHFKVAMGTAAKTVPADASFQEVTGIQLQFNTEEVAEGGENRFAHRLPTAAKYANLVLKRGVVVRNSPLAKWVGDTLGSNLAKAIVPTTLCVSLLDEQHNPLRTWAFVNAYPVRWDTSGLNASENQMLTETMEFAYHFFRIQ